MVRGFRSLWVVLLLLPLLPSIAHAWSSSTPLLAGGHSNSVIFGNANTLAIASDGSVWEWGSSRSRAGSGDELRTIVPLKVEGISNAIAVTTVGSTNLALTADGRVWSWGTQTESYGALGDGTIGSRYTPQIVAGLDNIVALEGSTRHVLALRGDGTVWAWGNNEDGQLGINSNTSSPTPVQVHGLSNVTAIAAGRNQSLALTRNGDVWLWGRNTNTVLPDSDPANYDLVPTLLPVPATIVAIAAGWMHVLLLDRDGTVWAFGQEAAQNRAQMGNGGRFQPEQVCDAGVEPPFLLSETCSAILTDVVAIAAGEEHSLALKRDGSVWSWGIGNNGELGDGLSADGGPSHVQFVPTQVLDLAEIVAIAAGSHHSFAVGHDGMVYGWGQNDFGQIGDGSQVNRSTPVPVLFRFDGPHALAAGTAHSLALKREGTVWGWGYAWESRLGQGCGGATVCADTLEIDSSLQDVRAIAAGHGHNLALLGDGTVRAWGLNHFGQLGDGTTTERDTPVAVTDLTDVVQIAAGGDKSIALKSDGTVWAWGTRINGQLGDGGDDTGPAFRSTPVQVVGLTGIVAIAAGSTHSLALTSGGTVWGWGNDASRQLGSGGGFRGPGEDKMWSPVMIGGLPGDPAVIAIAAGGRHSLALMSNGTVTAWGEAISGQLGLGFFQSVEAGLAVYADIGNVKAIAAGEVHSVALKHDGTVWTWGQDLAGQLGVGGSIGSDSPVQVCAPEQTAPCAQFFDRVTAIATGATSSHNLALRADGTTWGWGDNNLRQAGGSGPRPVPVEVAGLVTPPPDRVPDPFTFEPEFNALQIGLYTRTFTVSGIDSLSPIGIACSRDPDEHVYCFYRINGGEYRSTNLGGTVVNGDEVTVRVRGSINAGETVTGTLTIGGISGDFAVHTTPGVDSLPNDIIFDSIWGVPVNTLVYSSFRAVRGIDVPIPIRVTTEFSPSNGDVVVGEYSINGGDFTSEDGVVHNDDIIQVRVLSPGTADSQRNMGIYVGGEFAIFNVRTTFSGNTFDEYVDPFSFTPVIGAPVSSLQTSNTITVQGVSVATPISILGGEFSVDGGAFRTGVVINATLLNNSPVQVRQTSSSVSGTTTLAILNIGGVNATFSVTTGGTAPPPDTTPDAFSFTPVTGAALDSTVLSNVITVQGINAATPIEITGGEYAINGGAFTSASGNVANGNSVQLRLTSASANLQASVATLTIGSVSAQFTVTTLAGVIDTTPDAFSFAAVTGAALSTTVESVGITVQGINGPTPISITGGQYSVNNGGFTSASGTVNNGDSVAVRLTTSATNSATSVATLTIGGVNAPFSVATLAASAGGGGGGGGGAFDWIFLLMMLIAVAHGLSRTTGRRSGC